MEVILNYNWNVYKVFKSGKRAKAPHCQIEGENKEAVEKEFLEDLEPKHKKHMWSFVRSDLSQEREYEKILEKDIEVSRRKNNFLGRLAIKAGGIPNNIVTGLLFTEETNWEWRWAACEPATMKLLKMLSPPFKSAIKAEEWLDSQLNNKS